MKTLSFLLLFIGITAFAPPPEVKLTTTKLASGLSVGVPATFTPLPDDGIAVKYPSPRKPLAVFTNPSGRVDFSVAVRPTTFESMDYAVLLKIYKASIQRLYSKVEFLKEDIRTVKGRDFIYFEFVSTVSDGGRTSQLAPIKKYQTVQYAIQGQQMYVFTFVAPANEQAQWQPTAQAVMNAIALK
ncbi:hypothetical protein [Hymenobacter arizonensis]|uniref:PsbP C-terminal domain-containing protein n=1 Tax=Hymenobacter arizonensis TaxID=1227077 RepID=A0A1I5ZJ13_HYMAR|nr:hypothetical protein [Hymenobacter arizonensis]SFQ56456.1 hypothetical protein SAMN04515668_2956 [Hymenobacter arizonensis]